MAQYSRRSPPRTVLCAAVLVLVLEVLCFIFICVVLDACNSLPWRCGCGAHITALGCCRAPRAQQW